MKRSFGIFGATILTVFVLALLVGAGTDGPFRVWSFSPFFSNPWPTPATHGGGNIIAGSPWPTPDDGGGNIIAGSPWPTPDDGGGNIIAGSPWPTPDDGGGNIIAGSPWPTPDDGGGNIRLA
jgi:hypothetical protein